MNSHRLRGDLRTSREIADQYMQYYHEQPGDVVDYEMIRQAGINLVLEMHFLCPDGEMKDKAIAQVYDAVYKAQRAIAEERKPYARPVSVARRGWVDRNAPGSEVTSPDAADEGLACVGSGASNCG